MVNPTRETDELERCSQLFDNQNCLLSVSYGLKITRAFFEAKKKKNQIRIIKNSDCKVLNKNLLVLLIQALNQ